MNELNKIFYGDDAIYVRFGLSGTLTDEEYEEIKSSMDYEEWYDL